MAIGPNSTHILCSDEDGDDYGVCNINAVGLATAALPQIINKLEF